MAFGNELEWGGQHPATCAKQIDLHQADASLPQFFLFLQVEVTPRAGDLVGRAQDFNHRDNPSSGFDVDDLDETLPDGFVLIEMDDQRVGYRNAVTRPHGRLLASAAFDDPHVRDDVARLPFLGLDEHALVYTRPQITRQLLLERVAGIDDKPVVYISPVFL
jgi:hypothetical protein